MLLGLEYVIWIVLVAYFIGMLLLGWWSRHSAASQAGYLLGDRRFRASCSRVCWPRPCLRATRSK